MSTLRYTVGVSRQRIMTQMTVSDYLESERTSEVKREYVRGQVFALPTSSDHHNRLIVRLAATLLMQAEAKGCHVYVALMKLRAGDDAFYYPDVMVGCDEETSAYYKKQPSAIIEVLSPSTETTDRREKRSAYLALPSLTTYLLVDSESRRVEGYFRGAEGWEQRVWVDQGAVELEEFGVAIDVETLYKGILDGPPSLKA
jgi:Uma2 family endonuclease